MSAILVSVWVGVGRVYSMYGWVGLGQETWTHILRNNINLEVHPKRIKKDISVENGTSLPFNQRHGKKTAFSLLLLLVVLAVERRQLTGPVAFNRPCMSNSTPGSLSAKSASYKISKSMRKYRLHYIPSAFSHLSVWQLWRS